MSTRLDELLDRVRTWPAERQAQAEQLLDTLERLGDDRFALTSEQIEDVKRRLAEPDPKTLTMAEMRARFSARHE